MPTFLPCNCLQQKATGTMLVPVYQMCRLIPEQAGGEGMGALLLWWGHSHVRDVSGFRVWGLGFRALQRWEGTGKYNRV